MERSDDTREAPEGASLTSDEARALLDHAGMRRLGSGQRAALILQRAHSRLVDLGLLMRGPFGVTLRGQAVATRLLEVPILELCEDGWLFNLEDRS